MPREFALPGTRPKYARDRVVDVEHVKLVLDVEPDARKVAGVAHLQCAVIAAGTRWVELDAVELAIARVEVDGERGTFGHDGRVLRVDLGAPRDPGDKVTIAVEYSGSPRRGLYFIAPDP